MDQRHPEGDGAISRKKLNERLMAVLGQRTADLDDEEITAITEFCLKSVRRRTCHNLVQAGVEEIADSVQRHSSICDTHYIDADSFSKFMSNDSVDFDAVVKLLDQDRRRWLLERIFTPHSFRIGMERAEIPKLETSSTDSSKIAWASPSLESIE